MKNLIPDNPSEQEQFLHYLQHYKINAHEYKNLLARSNLPSRCILLPEAKHMLTSTVQHQEDCIKYNLISTVDVNNEEAFRDTIELNFRNIANTTDQILFVEMPLVVTTNNESDERHQLIDVNDSENVLLNNNDDVVTRTSETNVLLNNEHDSNILLNNEHDSNILSDNHQELSEDNMDMPPARQTQVTELIENNHKTPDVQRKDFDYNYEEINGQPIQSDNHIESETAEVTPSNKHTMYVKACVKAILQYPSIVLSSSDITLATRHFSAVARQRSIQLMIEKNLLCEDNYFVRKLSKSVKLTKGFAKRVPRLNDEESRFNFITVLNEFGITWESFKSFFDLTKDGFHTTTQLLLNETAEVLLDSEDYRSYVNYDKRAIFRPIENRTIEQDELEYGENITGIEPFESAAKNSGKRKKSKIISQSKRKKN